MATSRSKHSGADTPRAKEIFWEALERVEPERPAYLRAACGADASLRERVEALLAAHDAAAAIVPLLGEDHPTALTFRVNRGTALLAEVVATCARLLPDHPDQGGSLDEVSALAEESFEVNLDTLGPDHPDTLRSMVNMGLVRSRAGDLESAEEWIGRALEGFRRSLGPEHLETLTTQSDLVGVYTSQERYAEAEELSRATLEAAEGRVDPGGVPLAKFRARLALSILGQGDPAGAAEAGALLDAARAPLEQRLGPDSPWTRQVTGFLESLHELELYESP